MAITEPDAGSDNSSMRTTAVLDEETNEWILNGEKIFITNGKLALEESDGLCVVWATVDPGGGARGDQVVRRRRQHAGRDASPSRSTSWASAPATRCRCISTMCAFLLTICSAAPKCSARRRRKGFKGAMKTFDASRPAVAASAVGIARAALEFTAERLAEEGIVLDYSKSLHEMTAVERDLLEMEARYKGAWLLTLRAVALMAHGESNRLESSMCKFRAGEAVTWITQKAVELLGPRRLFARAAGRKVDARRQDQRYLRGYTSRSIS